MAKEQGTSTGSLGFFTIIARVIAVIALVLGSFIGIMLIAESIDTGDDAPGFLGLAILLVSWIGAPVLGTLSEISIKLSKLGGD